MDKAMDKNVEISLLLSFYSSMLTSKQAEAASLYYNQDFSLSEISENTGITRQGVRDSIKRAENTLYDIENRLGLMKKFLKIKSRLSDIDDMLKDIETEITKSKNDSSLKTIEKIKNIKDIMKEINDSY